MGSTVVVAIGQRDALGGDGGICGVVEGAVGLAFAIDPPRAQAFDDDEPTGFHIGDFPRGSEPQQGDRSGFVVDAAVELVAAGGHPLRLGFRSEELGDTGCSDTVVEAGESLDDARLGFV